MHARKRGVESFEKLLREKNKEKKYEYGKGRKKERKKEKKYM
jgi:hypothetical protein